MKQIAAALIYQDGKILIAQRSKKDALYGKWEFPGGKVEPGETLEDCLQRELLEELGIKAKISDYFCTTTLFKDCEMILFKVFEFTGEVQPLEHLALRWVFPEELVSDDMPPANAPIIDRLKSVLKADDT